MGLFVVSNIGTRLARARSDAGHTQKSLAEAVGATQQIITKIETGDVLNSKYFMPICEELGVSYAWLIKGKESGATIGAGDPDGFILIAMEALDDAVKSVKALSIRNGKNIESFDYPLLKRAFEIQLSGKLTGDYLTAALKIQNLKEA